MMQTLRPFLRTFSARASSPRATDDQRTIARDALRMLRAQFDDATPVETILYDVPAWALPTRDADGAIDVERFALTMREIDAL